MGEAKARGTKQERTSEAIRERLKVISKSEFATADERAEAQALLDKWGNDMKEADT